MGQSDKIFVRFCRLLGSPDPNQKVLGALKFLLSQKTHKQQFNMPTFLILPLSAEVFIVCKYLARIHDKAKNFLFGPLQDAKVLCCAN